MKRLISPLLLLVTLLLFTSCTNENRCVSKSQLEMDIINYDAIKNCHTDNWVYEDEYEFVDYNIVKRRINEEAKQDIIYCDVEVENEYFNVIIEVELIYNYYDVGGWILDECTHTKKEVSPLRTPEIELIMESFLDENNLKQLCFSLEEWRYEGSNDNLKCRNISALNAVMQDDEYSTTRFTVEIEFENLCMEAYVVTEFIGGKWHILNDAIYASKVLDTHVDYSKLIGSFCQEYISTEDTRLIVEEVDIINGTFNYRYTSRHDADYSMQTARLDYFNVGFDDGFCFDFENDVWIEKTLQFYPDYLKRVSSDEESTINYYSGSILPYHVDDRKKCGDSVSYLIDSDGTLVLYGSGKMYDFGYGYAKSLELGEGYADYCSKAPWYNSWDEITAIEIKEGITHIGDRAFYGLRNVTDVQIPDTLESIGDYAFSLCSFSEISLPNSLKIVGDSAFSCCDNLEKVDLPDGIMYLGEGVLSSCSELKKIVIPGSIKEIPRNMCFGCENIAMVEIGEGVEKVGGFAFAECRGLQSVYVPKSVNTISELSFDFCGERQDFVIHGNKDSYAEKFAAENDMKFVAS